jgi:phosphatidylserine/phosphatidylglycerophosphate/cardiolipin synthase-like enzyme
MLAWIASALFASTSQVYAQERLCDASAENCRIPLIALINNEHIGIDVGVWFFKDDRYVTALVNASKRGVRIRVLMDTRANATYPTNAGELDKLKAAGIPMRRRIAGDILHWKLMIFDGQGTVEWSGANFSSTAFVPQDPYKDYEDEVIYFSRQLVGSFMTLFDDIWTNTRDYTNYANVTVPLTRAHPTYPVDPRLNFPPKNSYQNRLVPLIDKEPPGGLIDVDMYRITMAMPVDALIRAAARGVRMRLYLEINEYNNPKRPGNKVQMDRLVAASKQYPNRIEIRMRAHLGINHQKTVWLRSQHIVVFGTSNWSDASDDNQLEANIFTDKDPGDGLNDFLYTELHNIFLRKFYDTSPVGSIETVAWRTPALNPKPDDSTDPVPPPPSPPPPPALPSSAPTIVLYASGATTTGNWQPIADTTAAGGTALANSNANAAKIVPALATPANYFELTFSAEANTQYHLWLRMRAQDDLTSNDSVHVQFSDSVTSSGAATMQIGSTSSASVVLQDGTGDTGVHSWGWADNGWDAPGVPIYFAKTGTHTIRIQQREDGAIIDQIVLSPNTFLAAAPGPRDDDTTILPPSGDAGNPPPPPPPSSSGDILLHPAAATTIVGDWVSTPDQTAATGASLLNPDRAVPKMATALAAPPNYFEMTFDAPAGTAFRLWMRGKATADSWANDSVFVQFDDSVDAGGVAKYRTGTADGARINLEDCGGCGLAAWGWQDNGYGAGVLGPLIYFTTAGQHTIRVQPSEDGLAIDQILLSPQQYLSQPPGPPTNDTTILQ